MKLVHLLSYGRVENTRQLVVNASIEVSTAKTEAYSYDRFDRLTRAWTNASGSWGRIDFTCDQVGSRLTKVEGGVTTSYHYTDLLPTPKLLCNQLNRTVAGTTIWYYNCNGNGDLIRENGTTVRWNYQFNAMDQLTEVVKWTKSGSSWSIAPITSPTSSQGESSSA